MHASQMHEYHTYKWFAQPHEALAMCNISLHSNRSTSIYNTFIVKESLTFHYKRYHLSRIIGEHYIWRFAQKILLAGF